MKNPAFEQPFKSARTNSRSLLLRSRRRGHAAAAHCRVWLHTAWPCKAGAWSRGFYQCVARHGRPNPSSAWLGMLEKVRMISGIRKQRPGLPGSQGKVHPMLNFSLFISLHPLLATALTAFAAALTAWTPAAHATIGVWPDTFRARQMPVSGGAQYVRVGG